jgi:hypothetical protein
MIQFRRGSTKAWKDKKTPILAAGQPGYDKEKHIIKVGDGEKSWAELESASGLSDKGVLDSEAEAKKKLKNDSKDITVITYGTGAPDKNTVGKVYLQYYDAEPEADYIIASGVDGIWTYQVFKSGIVRCWGTLPVTTTIQNAVGDGHIFNNEVAINNVSYPFTFDTSPVETATLISAKNKIAWLASTSPNSKTSSGVYTILSFDKHASATYKIALDVKGTIDRNIQANKNKLG